MPLNEICRSYRQLLLTVYNYSYIIDTLQMEQ